MTILENDFGIERVSMTKEEFIINRLTYLINGLPFIEIDGNAIEVNLT
tara:strand:+ start:356 stop:499 length:144 start_codon:yes stop_codon:yes gene_type:complete